MLLCGWQFAARNLSLQRMGRCLKSMIGESCDSAAQARPLSFLSLCWGLGTVIGKSGMLYLPFSPVMACLHTPTAAKHAPHQANMDP